MSKKFSITIDDWVAKEIIGNPKIISRRIQELVIKGYYAEKLGGN